MGISMKFANLMNNFAKGLIKIASFLKLGAGKCSGSIMTQEVVISFEYVNL